MADPWVMPNDESRREYGKIRDHFDALPICWETVSSLDQCVAPDMRRPFVPFVLGKMFIRCCHHCGDDRDELIAHMLTKYNLHDSFASVNRYNRLTPTIRRMFHDERYRLVLLELVDHPVTDHQFAILENVMTSQVRVMVGDRQEDELLDRATDYLREKATHLIRRMPDDERCELVLRNWSHAAVQTRITARDLLRILPDYFAHLQIAATDHQLQMAPEWAKRSLLVTLLEHMLLIAPWYLSARPNLPAFQTALIERLAEYPQNYQQLARMPWLRDTLGTMRAIMEQYERGQILMNTDGLFRLAWNGAVLVDEIMKIDAVACSWIRSECCTLLLACSQSGATRLAMALQRLSECPCHCCDRRHPGKKPLHCGPLPIDQNEHTLLATLIDGCRVQPAPIDRLEVVAAYTRISDMPVHYYVIDEMILLVHRPAATLAEIDSRSLRITPSLDRDFLTVAYEGRSIVGVSITDAKLTRDQIVDAYLSIRKKSAGSAK